MPTFEHELATVGWRSLLPSAVSIDFFQSWTSGVYPTLRCGACPQQSLSWMGHPKARDGRL